MSAEEVTDKATQSPVAALDSGDPVDAMSCFRYQYPYGVILLAAATVNEFDYVAVRCEQHGLLHPVLPPARLEGTTRVCLVAGKSQECHNDTHHHELQ